jgi:hypothetical protein
MKWASTTGNMARLIKQQAVLLMFPAEHHAIHSNKQLPRAATIPMAVASSKFRKSKFHSYKVNVIFDRHKKRLEKFYDEHCFFFTLDKIKKK